MTDVTSRRPDMTSSAPRRMEPSAAPPAGMVTEPPVLTGIVRWASDSSRVLFRLANRTIMVPLHRAGLSAWLGNPLTGWQCLLTTRGRRSGLPRPTPLGYIVMDGAAWVMAGYGPSTQWYRNILAEPGVDVLLPGRRPFAALAEEVRDPILRARVIPPLCRSMALPGLMIGCVPAISSDERILGCVSWVPLVRVRPADGSSLATGPEDPGGRGWVWRQLGMVGATAGLPVLLKRLLRG